MGRLISKLFGVKKHIIVFKDSKVFIRGNEIISVLNGTERSELGVVGGVVCNLQKLPLCNINFDLYSFKVKD